MLRWGVCVVLLLLSGVLYVKTSKAIDTKPVLRAKSRDAKFIFSSFPRPPSVKLGDTES
jgi:hypothetical protein